MYQVFLWNFPLKKKGIPIEFSKNVCATFVFGWSLYMQLIKEYVEGGFVSYCDSFAVDVIVDSVEITL